MKNWGLALVTFYAIVVFILLSPTIALIGFAASNDGEEILNHWATWICAGLVIAGEVFLLWLSVDTSHQRLKPRTHILLSVGSTGMFVAILTVAVVVCLAIAIYGDRDWSDQSAPWARIVAIVGSFLIPWLVWSLVFYRLWKNASDPITRGVAWLFRGSVLELLVAVPAHVISRRRGDCCAPMVSGVGISCGIAVMLLSFGPSVLLLYKKRLERYSARARAVS